MAPERPFPLRADDVERGQRHYLILSTLDPRQSLAAAFAQLRSGEVGYIDLQLREGGTERQLAARLRFPDGLPQENLRFEETWHFYAGVFRELDADNNNEGPAFSCNGHFTLADVALPGEIRVSTDTTEESM